MDEQSDASINTVPPVRRLGDPPEVWRELLRVIEVIPVPGARPYYARADEAAGLTILGLALQMDHVHRVAEQLSVDDRTHMRRSVAVDVDLRRIDATQRLALAERPLGPLAGAEQGPPRIWIPLARQSRGDLASVAIRCETGDVVPRLTSSATQLALIAGLTRLLKNQIRTSERETPDSSIAGRTGRPGDAATAGGHEPQDSVGPLSHPDDLQARWLIERAVAQCVERGPTEVWQRLSREVPPDSPSLPDAAPGGQVPEQSNLHRVQIAARRSRARTFLERLGPSQIEEFAALLEIAVTQQLLIALVPTDAVHLHLHYDAPPIPTRPGPQQVGKRLRDLLHPNREYTIEYETRIPRRLSAYHVSVDVPEEIQVRRFLLSTDSDDVAVEGLAADLERLAGEWTQAGEFRHSPPPVPTSAAPALAVREAELADALSRLASLSRIRMTNLTSFRAYVDRALAPYGGRLPDPSWRAAGPTDLGKVTAGLAAGRCSLDDVVALGVAHERGLMADHLASLPVETFSQAMLAIARYLREHQLGWDVSVDNDPRENGAHAHWRHVNLRFGPRVNEPVTARFCLTLADEPPSLIESVGRMVLALLVIVAFIAWFVRSGTIAQADAVVAVLLLVPGILLSRLDIPKTHSILGELRKFPTRVAYVSVTATSLLALAAAADGADFSRWAVGVSGVLAFQLLLCGYVFYARALRRRVLLPRSQVVPRWLSQALLGWDDGPPDVANARFEAMGSAEAEVARGTFWFRWNERVLKLSESRSRRAAVRRRRAERPAKSTVQSPTGRSSQTSGRRGQTGLSARPTGAVSRAARSVVEQSTGVGFEVRHLPHAPADNSAAGSGRPPTTEVRRWPVVRRGRGAVPARRPRALARAGEQDEREPSILYSEMLGFTAFGTSVEVRTRPVVDHEAIVGSSWIGDSKLVNCTDSTLGSSPLAMGALAKGIVVPGPKLLGPGGDYTEVLISLGTELDLSHRHSRMAMHVLHEIVSALADSHALPVNITFPTAEPARMDGPTEKPHNATSPCIRLAVSNYGQLAEPRSVFEERLITLAEDLGLGLWLSQGRASSRPGRWRQVREFNKGVFTCHEERLFGHVSSEVPRHVRQVTLLLPATRETATDIRALGCLMRRDGMGCLALTAWPLQKAVFLTVMIPCADGVGLSVGHAPQFGDEARIIPTGSRYRSLRQDCRIDPGQVEFNCIHDQGRGTFDEHQLVLLSSAAVPAPLRHDGTVVVPFWVAWDLPERADVDRLIANVLAGFDRANDQRPAWVTFVRARHNERDHLRGRAKVAAVVPGGWRRNELGILAQQAQRVARELFDADMPRRSRTLTLQIAWGERWLGQPE